MPKTRGIWEWGCPKRWDAQNAVTAPCIHYQAFSRIFDKSKYCCTEREIISSKQPAINVNYSNCCDFTYGVKHATVNKRWNEYHTTWICNTRPWSSFNKEGTVFVLLLPEEPAAEPLAWPVEEEFGFLDLLILATVFTPPKSKQMRHLCHIRMKSEDIGNFPNKLRHIFGRMAWFYQRGVLTGFYVQLSIGGNRRKKEWITCICLQLVSSSFRRPTSSSRISKNSSFQV